MRVSSATAAATLLRDVVHSIDPQQPIDRIVTLEQAVSASTADRRFYAVSVGAFSALALLLVIVGLYGLTSTVVAERTREIGIRMALGAGRRDILGHVLRQGLFPVAVGLFSGLVGSAWVSRLLRRFLFEIGPLDPATNAVVTILFCFISLVACSVPASRATRLTPSEAFRDE